MNELELLAKYFEKLREFQILQTIVCTPRFGESPPYKITGAWGALSLELRKIEDDLFNLYGTLVDNGKIIKVR